MLCYHSSHELPWEFVVGEQGKHLILAQIAYKRRASLIAEKRASQTRLAL
jgi:hypothetical protein